MGSVVLKRVRNAVWISYNSDGIESERITSGDVLGTVVYTLTRSRNPYSVSGFKRAP